MKKMKKRTGFCAIFGPARALSKQVKLGNKKGTLSSAFCLLFLRLFRTKGEVRNFLDVGTSNLTILAEVSQHVSDALIGQTAHRGTNFHQTLNGDSFVSSSQCRQDVSLKAFILDLRLGGLTSGITLLIQKFNLMIDESNHLSIVNNSLANLSEHLSLCHNIHLFLLWGFALSLSYILIIT